MSIVDDFAAALERHRPRLNYKGDLAGCTCLFPAHHLDDLRLHIARDALVPAALPSESVLIDVLGAHLPVIVRDGKGGVRSAGCSCGQDPLDLTVHVARAVRAALGGERP